MNKWVEILGFGVMYGFSLTAAVTFFVAFFSPGMKLIISVNMYGEAIIEFIFFMITIPFVGYVAGHNIGRIVKKAGDSV